MVFKDQFNIQPVQKMVQCTRIWYMNLRRAVRIESLSTIFLVYKDYLNLEKEINLFFKLLIETTLSIKSITERTP